MGPGLVVVVSGDPAERQRLIASLPPDVTVVVAPTREAALAVLSGSGSPEEATATVGVREVGDPTYFLESATREVRVGERKVHLTPLEFSMLRVLASEPGRVWSFSELSVRVWATGYVGGGDQVRAVVKRLRRKLGEAQIPVHIETVRGMGLRLRQGHSPGAEPHHEEGDVAGAGA